MLTGVPWQRCQFQLMRNAMADVPKVTMRPVIARDIRRVFDADEPAKARAKAAEDERARREKAANDAATAAKNTDVPVVLAPITIMVAEKPAQEPPKQEPPES